MEPSELAEVLETRASTLCEARQFKQLHDLLKDYSPNSLRKWPGLLFYKAIGTYNQGNYSEVLLLLEQYKSCVLEFYTPALAYRVLNVLGTAYAELSRYDESEDCLRIALGMCEDLREAKHRPPIMMNVGVISLVRRDWHNAISLLNRALLEASAIGRRDLVGACHLNLGMGFRQLCITAKAHFHFETARKYAHLWGTEELRIAIDFESASMTLLTGDTPAGEIKASRAVSKARLVPDRSLEGEARRVLGMLQIANGDRQSAFQNLQIAHRIAVEWPRKLLEAEVEEILAQLAFTGADWEQYERRLARSDHLYAEMGLSGARIQPNPVLVRAVEQWDQRKKASRSQ